ncbi:MAG: hypothetical protein PHP74_02350 [Candidatus Gracilibacteria bacterium]|nr:hypothetical protein [Candidatus Gracilibacteria bacterium]
MKMPWKKDSPEVDPHEEECREFTESEIAREKLIDWAEKRKIDPSKSVEEIREIKGLRKIRNWVVGSILALGIGLGGVHVANKWDEGFNNQPRGAYPGIMFKNDPNTNRQLQCLMDDWYDKSHWGRLFPNNKWKEHNCADVRISPYSINPLTDLANKKNEILRRKGLQTDHPNEPAVIEWRDYGWPGWTTHVKVDEERLKAIQEEQIRETGKSNFSL